jgi:dsDNA-specific endonuclease/ATPase MutS2
LRGGQVYVESDTEVSFCIKQLTKEIWATIKMVLKSTATAEEIDDAAARAKFLRLYIERYRTKRFNSLTDTELWLATEVAEAVQDLID